MRLKRHQKVNVAGGSLEVCGAASTVLNEINSGLEDHCQTAPFSQREGAVCQEDHVVGSVRRHPVHRSVDDGAGAVRAHEDTRVRVCWYLHRFRNTTKKGEKLSRYDKA